MKKKAFSLIEVLVAVVILSTVAVLLFEISTNSKNNFSFLSKKANFTTLASMPIMHSNYKYHHREVEIYEFIKDSYDIKDDELRTYLKDKKIHFTYEEFTSFSPLGDEDIAEDEGIPNFTIVFDKIEVYNKKQSTFVYKIYMR